MKLTALDITTITGGSITGPNDITVNEIITDSRQSTFYDGLGFLAIRGKNHDGHEYIPILYEKGIRVFITDLPGYEKGKFPEASFIVTCNTVDALQKLAAYVRKSFRYPVIAITGSAGKTIVKEWLADILGQNIPVIRSPRSYNSQIGVPLSVLRLDESFRLGIFEAGISMPGEMEKLERIIHPDIGIITNIGDAHSENFPDNSLKALEKLELFKNASTIIYCHDHELIRKLIADDKNLNSKNIIGWSFADRKAEIFVERKIAGERTSLNMYSGDSIHYFNIPFTDRASIENAVTVASCCLAMGMESSLLAKGLESLVSVAMRMELKNGINNCRLIEDFYNSDPGSLGMALEYLKSQKGRKPALILSDFVQSGRNERELYGEVARLVERSGIRKFIGIGKALSANSDLFDSSFRFYDSTADFILNFSSIEFRNEIILLKGARRYEFENIARLLEEQVHQTVLEVNLDAISHNLNEFRRLIDPGTRIMAMVKAFAYGAGPAEIASLLEYHRISYLTVAYADEGVELRNGGVSLPVMVMNPDPGSEDLMIRYSLEPEIYSFESLDRFEAAASRHGLVNYPVHVKIDTGMHRLGFMPEEAEKLVHRLKSSGSVRVVSVFSHLAASDDPSLDSFTHKQVELFKTITGQMRAVLGYSFMRHILNSSGIIRFPQYQFDMVRIGIGMYGTGYSEGVTLKPVSRFRTSISQVKLVRAGEPVGYGCADVSGKERMIAIVPVGYADGLRRMLGNRNGSLFIRGSKVPIIGNVCMDMCMADVSGSDAKPGDEAEIFGSHISVEEVADKCGTIPYEILTSIPPRVKRIFFRE